MCTRIKVAAVQGLLAHELERREQGDLFAVRLRCPDGGSLHYRLLERRPELAGRFLQPDVIYQAPEDDSWVSDSEEIQRVAPVLDLVTMRRHYEGEPTQ